MEIEVEKLLKEIGTEIRIEKIRRINVKREDREGMIWVENSSWEELRKRKTRERSGRRKGF